MHTLAIGLPRHVVVTCIATILSGCGASSTTERRTPENGPAETAIVALRNELQEVHRRLDIKGFAELHTDSGVLEWQGMAKPVVGRAALEANRREVWESRRDLTLQITVASLNIHGNHAYEFSSFAERWVDPDGSRMTELGRYVTAYVVDQSGRWRIVRIFGFTDSVSKEPRRQ